METDQNHECSTLPNLAINPDVTHDLSFDSDIRSNTKAILENVCNDFENIDVLSSKENKFIELKKWKPPDSFSEYSTDENFITDITVERNEECATTENAFISNTASSQTESIQSSAIDESILNPQMATAIVVPVLDSPNQTSTEIVNSDPSKVGILSDNFTNDKNLSSSLAELADAEIIQTSENAVSIIISNPRFIQVLNCKDSGLPSDTSDITLDRNCIVSEKENFNEVIVDGTASGVCVSDYSLHEDNAQKVLPTEVANEIIYSSEEVFSFNSSTPNTLHSKEKTRPYFRSRADLGKMAATKARRITAKMKTEWIRMLDEKGVLVCPLSGCFQRYRTMANFMTHYKHCYSGMDKDLKHCPYCASVIFSSHTAVLHHMKVEHPEKLNEYKANYPEPENAYDSFEDENSTRLVEISQKNLKNHKRKYNMAKENRLSPKRRLLKNKQRTINQPVIENSQLRECGHFDEIVSKISSISSSLSASKTQSAERNENKLTKEKRIRKHILTGRVVTAEKYFDDERDEDDVAIDIPFVEQNEAGERVHTKSRLVLNMERYKRYTQYLTVTRDFGSHRRTYSRPKSSNLLDSTQQTSFSSDLSESDIHQLASMESSGISLNGENDDLCLSNNNSDLCCVPPEISAFDPLQSEASILNKIHLDSKTKRSSIGTFETKGEIESFKYNEPMKERIPCYKQQINTLLSPKIEPIASRKPSMRACPIITYGKIPDTASAPKSDRLPTVDFDSLVNSTSVKKLNSTEKLHRPIVEKSKKNICNKEDGIKLPHKGIASTPPFKRKRGRPRKISLSENSHAHTPANLKSLKKPGNLKRVQKQKTTFSKSNKKIAKKSKLSMNRISSKMHSKLLQKRRMKISAKSSLKKAIMCGVKRNTREKSEGKRGRGRPPKVCVRSFLKNAKVSKEDRKKKSIHSQNPMCSTPLLQNSNADHNYFSSLQICDSYKNNSLNNYGAAKENLSETRNTLIETENNCSISLLPSKDVEFSEILAEEVVISCTEPLAHTENEVALPVKKGTLPIQNEKEDIAYAHTQSISIPKISTTISSDVQTVPDLPVSSQPSTNDDKIVTHKEDSSTPCVAVKRSRGRPRKSATPQETIKLDEKTHQVNKLVHKISTPATPGVRKSERVLRKRKGEELDEASESGSPDTHTFAPNQGTEKDDVLTSSGEIVVKTGRRGRPRKYPRILTEKDDSSSEPKKTAISNLLECHPDASATVPVNNKEFETPYNATRSRARRERLELEKDKEGISKKHSHTPVCEKADEVEGKSQTTVNEETELILPLKKRKKLEKINCIKSSSSVANILLEKEKTPEKREKQSSDKIENNDLCTKIKENEELRTASLCTPPVIEVENDLSDKDAEPKKRERELCRVVPRTEIECEMFADVCGEIYPSLKPDIQNFKVLSKESKEIWRDCLESSVSVKLNTTSYDWMKLNCFDSISLDDSNGAMFFTGGPIQCCAFCPVPSHMPQYFAVASSDIYFNGKERMQTQDYSLSYANTKNEKGLIQFYNLGCLESNRINQLPSMELALEHTHGIITAMKFCPRGCYDLPPEGSNDGGSRLGLLALSCSDSYVRVYSVPHPNILPKIGDGNNRPIYNASPSLVLTPLFSETCSLTRKTIATCVDWHQNTQVIAAGYGNGCICVWMVKIILAPAATIVTVKNKDQSLSIQPYLVFDAFGTPVQSLSFAPLDNCEYLVGSSFDKTLRFFDLHDTSMPFCSIKRGFAINDCKWAKGFCGSLVSLHDGINFKGSTFVKECGTEEFPASNIASPVVSLACSAISNIDDVQAIADSNGTVSVNFFHCSCDEIKQPYFDTHVLFETEVVALDEDKRLSLDKAINTEVSAILNDAMDIVEVVIDEFSKLQSYEYNSTDNLQELVSSNIVEVNEMSYYEPELEDLMNDLLESMSEELGNSTINIEDIPTVTNLECQRLHRTNENEEMTCVSPGFFTCDNLKEKSYFPIEEMVINSPALDKRQLEDVTSSNKELKISEQLKSQSLSLTNELTCIHNSLTKDYFSGFSVEGISDAPNFVPNISDDEKLVDSDCSQVLKSCVKTVCDIVLGSCSASKLEHVSQFNEFVESKSDCNTVPEKSVGQECKDVPPQSFKAESITVQESLKSGSNIAIQKSRADSSDISNHGESNFSDDDLSIISECTSDSCDSIPSFLSDSLAPATPPESPILIYGEEVFSPVACHTVSLLKNAASEAIDMQTEEENCVSELADREPASEIENNVPNVEELQSNKMPELEDCISHTSGEQSNLNHSNALDPPLNFDSSSLKPEFFLEEQNSDSVVPNCLLLNESDHIETISGESSLLNDTNNSVEEILQSSRESIENGSSSETGFLEEGTNELLQEESPVSYASLLSTCGLIFKDVNANSSSSDERKDSLAIESNMLACVNSISWNPNYGCHFWMVTAGNSGIARLICVSELSQQENTSLLDKESIM